MKKDKEWLKGEIKNFQEGENMFTDEFNAGVQDALEYVQELIDQIDEPETLSQEWIDENKVARIDNLRKMTTSDVVTVEKLKNLLVPKKEKPVIPQFVADFIRATKPNNSLRLAFEYIAQRKIDNYDDELAFWIEEGNSELFASAWLDGYEVEKEKLYRVIDRHEVYLLAKEEERNKVETVAELVEIYGYEYVELNYQLTEQEIKDYDERYWVFAEEVTPCN